MTFSAEQSESSSRQGIVALVLAVIFFASARTIADPDLWGHVRFGQDILAEGIPATDPYSYLSAGHPWINHELLAEVAFGAVYSRLGPPGLIGMKAAIVLLILILVYRRLCRGGMQVLRAGMTVLAVMLLMSVGLQTVRPQLFTYLLFLLTLLLIDRAERGGTTAFWALPAVMLVWANSHGGFLAGLGVLGVWAATHFLLRLRPAGRQNSVDSPRPAAIAALLALSAGATLVNPYGVDLLAFLLRTATVARPEIGEWQPIAIFSRQGAAYLLVLAAALIALLRSRQPRRPALIAVFLVMALLPLQALRHLPLFALSFAVLVGEHLEDAWNRWSPGSSAPSRKLLPVAGFLGAAIFFAAALPRFGCIAIDPSFIRFPARAVALLKQTGVEGNLATYFDWGEYIIWHLSPQVRVSIDGRRETAYSQESYARSLQFLYGTGEWDALLENAPTDMALVGRDQPTYALMRLKPGWLLVYEDSLSGLFARVGSEQAEAIQRAVPPELPSDGAGLCFP